MGAPTLAKRVRKHYSATEKVSFASWFQKPVAPVVQKRKVGRPAGSTKEKKAPPVGTPDAAALPTVDLASMVGKPKKARRTNWSKGAPAKLLARAWQSWSTKTAFWTPANTAAGTTRSAFLTRLQIPKTTFTRECKSREDGTISKPRGRRSVLVREEQDMIIDAVKAQAELNEPLKRKVVVQMVKRMASLRHPGKTVSKKQADHG